MSVKMKVLLLLTALVIIMGISLFAISIVNGTEISATFNPIQIAGEICASSCTTG